MIIKVKSSVLISLLMTVVSLTNLCEGQRRALYGQPCNRLTRCDSRAALTCRNAVCGCALEDTMTYNRRYSRCEVFPSEKCVFTTVAGGDKVEERSWKEELPCVDNAVCQDTFCTCFTGFFETSNGTCLRQRGHREDCETSSGCRDDQQLICWNNKCDCNSTLSTFDFSRLMCVRRAGSKCDDLQFCVRNSYCTYYPNGSICQCESGYFGNADGACERKRSVGEECLDNSYCRENEQLACSTDDDGQLRCGCDTSVSVFDTGSKMCRRLAGAACDGFPYCVENSECASTGDQFRATDSEESENDYFTYGMKVPIHPNPNSYIRDTSMKCKCISGYFQNENGTCEVKRGFAESCESNDNCKEGLRCDTDETGKCQCQLSSVFDRAKQRCVGVANAACDNSDGCITNAECRWGNGDNRLCVCQGGFAHSSNGSCLASFGVGCSNHWTSGCNTEQGLVCKDGLCACKYEEFQSFDTTQQKCVSQTHGPCDDATPCVANSHCTANNENGIYWCQCNKGYVEVDGQCDLTIGQQCYNNVSVSSTSKSKYPRCDSLAPLHCIDGICKCRELQVYDTELSKCRGQIGSPCILGNATNISTSTNDHSCIDGGECVKRRFHIPWIGICKCKAALLTTRDRRCTAPAKRGRIVLSEEQFVGSSQH